MELTKDHRTRLNEAIRMVNDYALRSAVIEYLVANAWGEDCLFFLEVLGKKCDKEMKSDFGAWELHEDLHHHLNNKGLYI